MNGNQLLTMSESSAMTLRVCMQLAKPIIFQEAWSHPNLKQYLKCIDTIRMELADMNKQQVCHKIKQLRKVCVKYKRFFKIKRNAIFCNCLVACGCSQITDVEF